MMPLSIVKTGEKKSIKKVGGVPEIRLRLEDLGFVKGTPVTVLTRLGGNIIVRIKESRIALSRELAEKVIV